MARKDRSAPANYGLTAEKRVDKALAVLVARGALRFWFRADNALDSRGVDHVFGIDHPQFAVWVLQVSCGRRKRRSYYKNLRGVNRLEVKKPYRKFRYYRYIPLLAVTQEIGNVKIYAKLASITRNNKSIFENKRCPVHLKSALIKFLSSKGIEIPEAILRENTQ